MTAYSSESYRDESYREPAPTDPARSSPPKSFARTLAKNCAAALVFIGIPLGVETGYFSNDRISRAEWNEMERLKTQASGRVVYEANFANERIPGPRAKPGYWDFYNQAGSDTVSLGGSGLELTYTEPWIGGQFRHLGYEPSRIYRVSFEASVEGQPAAILMRNRQMDFVREAIPVTNGEFRTFQHHYVAPGGRLDYVSIIFIPDPPQDVKGRMTIRKFRIELMGG